MDQFSSSDSDFEDRFLLLGKMEILSALQDLMRRREAISAVFNGGRDALLTQLLSVRNEGIVFDRSVDEAINKRLLASERVVFRARPDGVPVHFACGTPQRVSWDNGEALWTPLPVKVARMQRREVYRVTAPVAVPIMISITAQSGESYRLPIHDLSVAGFGVSAPSEGPFPEQGTVLTRVTVHLPDREWLELTGEIRHLSPIENASGRPKRRAGIFLKSVGQRTDATLQRLVIRLDQEHHKLSRGN